MTWQAQYLVKSAMAKASFAQMEGLSIGGGRRGTDTAPTISFSGGGGSYGGGGRVGGAVMPSGRAPVKAPGPGMGTAFNDLMRGWMIASLAQGGYNMLPEKWRNKINLKGRVTSGFRGAGNRAATLGNKVWAQTGARAGTALRGTAASPAAQAARTQATRLLTQGKNLVGRTVAGGRGAGMLSRGLGTVGRAAGPAGMVAIPIGQIAKSEWEAALSGEERARRARMKAESDTKVNRMYKDIMAGRRDAQAVTPQQKAELERIKARIRKGWTSGYSTTDDWKPTLESGAEATKRRLGLVSEITGVTNPFQSATNAAIDARTQQQEAKRQAARAASDRYWAANKGPGAPPPETIRPQNSIAPGAPGSIRMPSGVPHLVGSTQRPVKPTSTVAPTAKPAASAAPTVKPATTATTPVKPQ